MLPRQVLFDVFERTNVHCAQGKEWALSVQFPGDALWVIQTWSTKPKPETVQISKDIILRSFEVYHNQIKVPRFHLEAIDQE